MPNNEILPEAQAYSDAIMHTRYIALELKQAAFNMENARVALQTKLMADDTYKIMAMDAGDIEEESYRLVSMYGVARKIHKWANELGRRLGVKMPATPTYSEEYQELVAGRVSVRLSAPARR
jgi:hypothetical protein